MSVKTEHPDPTDPAMSPLKHFGKEVRIERERLGMSRAELGKAAHCGYSLVAKIEQGERLPALDFAEACDRVFPTAGGRFVRLWPLIIKYAYPSWFRPFVELEALASAIRSFEVQVVPGLLQTEEYARAVLEAGRLRTDSLDELVAARMERQRILTREFPPELWVVLDENVLNRQMGSSRVFAAQLARLVQEAETPSTVIQVIPHSAGGHAGLGGAFAALTMDEGPDVVYVEAFVQGQILADPANVKAAMRVYDLLTAVALSPSKSLDLIHTTMKELSP
ncbi:Scr1 family TA system antitoxin-like transcriptional regulator [Streptomyces polygonati]|uniref:Scr1 family TA system antitoxin-like transcriptional regulator n=1 Tax=Streptomyces polygonati TaxID=1617087 RepID=A0ABV8HVR6_9ACTN